MTLPNTYPRGKTIIFQRAVPKRLQARYGSKTVKVDLKTGDVRVAARKVTFLRRQYEAEWAALDASPHNVPLTVAERAAALLKAWGLEPGSASNCDDAVSLFRDSLDATRAAHAAGDEAVYFDKTASFLAPHEAEAAQLLSGIAEPRLSAALEVYLKTHKNRNVLKFTKHIRARFTQMVSLIGDKAIDDTKRADGHEYAEKLLATGVSTSTVRRYIKAIQAVLTVYLREKEIVRINPFASIPIPSEGEDVEEAAPYTAQELATVLAAALAKDDDQRWLLAMLSVAQFGRALRSQCRGREFDPHPLHQVFGLHLNHVQKQAADHA